MGPMRATGVAFIVAAALAVPRARASSGPSQAILDFAREHAPPERYGGWREMESPHFRVYYRTAFAPSGFVLDLEKIHSLLRLDLARFAPWMVKERIVLYLYPDRKSYLVGGLAPPGWSNGIAYYDKKLVAVHDIPDRSKLLAVITHETTHLLFESYWEGTGRRPPPWLDEGVAMNEESLGLGGPEQSEWYEDLKLISQSRLMPLSKFFAVNPAADLADQEAAGYWYLESFSIAYFLLHEHPRLQFQSFCAGLKAGHPLTQVLWDAYRYRDIEAFQKAWRGWFRLKFSAAPVRLRTASPRAETEDSSSKTGGRRESFKGLEFQNFGFHGLRGDSDGE